MKKLLFLCLAIFVCLTSKVKVCAMEQVSIPSDIQELCEKYGEEYGICPELIEAMCWHESRCNPSVGTTYKGLTQINSYYFKSKMNELNVTDLYDAEQNIKVCASTLRDYFEEQNDVYYVLMCWNSGSTKAKRLYKQGIFTKYAVMVSETSSELEKSHSK